MASKPILFNTEMVKAILDGRKTMTRRLVKPQPVKEATQFERYMETVDCGFEARFGNNVSAFVCDRKPQYKPGDILWVQETWKVIRLLENMQMQFEYRADGVISKTIDFLLDRFTKFKKFADKNGWQSPYFMPREAARIFIRVTNVRVGRLWDISESDTVAEGFRIGDQPGGGNSSRAVTAKQSFMWTWQRLYDKGEYPWALNPWVWVYEFERVEKP